MSRKRQVVVLSVECPEDWSDPRDWMFGALLEKALLIKGEAVVRVLTADPVEHIEEPRSYVVGLPVIVTVNPDGTVTHEVDLSEAAEAVADEGASESDYAAVERYIERQS